MWSVRIVVGSNCLGQDFGATLVWPTPDYFLRPKIEFDVRRTEGDPITLSFGEGVRHDRTKRFEVGISWITAWVQDNMNAISGCAGSLKQTQPYVDVEWATSSTIVDLLHVQDLDLREARRMWSELLKALLERQSVGTYYRDDNEYLQQKNVCESHRETQVAKSGRQVCSGNGNHALSVFSLGIMIIPLGGE